MVLIICNFTMHIILFYSVFIYIAIWETNALSIMGLSHVRLQTELLTYEKCADEGNGVYYFEGRQSRKNRTVIVENANLTLHIPLDNKIKFKLAIDIWGNGGWRPNGFVLELDNACEDILKVLGKEVSQALFDHCSPNIPNKCPIKPGVYLERDLDVTIYNKMSIPSFIPGTWRAELMFFRKSDKQLLGCIRRVVRVSYVKS